MAFSVVFGLAILSVANYGNAFEFSGLDPSLQSKFKSITKPFSALNVQPRFGEQVKPAFGFKSVDAKPLGAPFDPFKQSYQQYQPGPLRTNYQPFGPYPGYPGPVVYPGQAPSAYPQPSYRFDNSNNKPFGFQPFPAPAAQPFSAPAAQPAFNPYKFGSTKKFNKFAEPSDFNQAGKYFQQHQFGTYHTPEFTSAIVPAEHNIKQSRPKETLLGKPIIPSLSEFGLPNRNPFGFAPPSSFKYPVPQFPQQFQPFYSTVVPSVNSIPTTAVPENFRFSSTPAAPAVAVSTAAAPSSTEEPATARVSEVTDEPSATPAADPQPTGPSQEEVTASDATTAAAEVATDNEAPAAVEQSQQSSQAAEGGEPSADDKPAAQENDSEGPAPVVVEEQVREDKPAAQEVDSQLTGSSPVVSEPAPETSSPVNDPAESSTASGSDSSSSNTAGKSEEAVTENLSENKPTESGASAVNLPGLPNELYGALPPASDPASLGLFASSGFPYFGQSAEFQQSPYLPYYDAPKFSDEELKSFAANFGSDGFAFPSAAQVVGDANVAVKDAESANAGPVPVSTETSVPVSSTPLAEKVVKIESVQKAESGEKKEPTGGESESRNVPEEPKKTNAVQIIQDDPFNGQLPLLFDPSNTASPLNTFKFYSHPSVSALSSQAAVASYSPEDAFTNFGTQFRQGYLVEGSPSLTPLPKTILELSNQTPLSISSADHPLHSQVFKYSQSFVPYPGLVPSTNTHVYRSLEVPSSSTVASAPLPLVADDATSSTAAAVSSTTEAAADSAATTVAA